MTTAYLAAEGFADQLQEELRRAGVAVVLRHERLFVCDGPAIAAAWAANIWHDCVELPVASIGSAAQALRDIQRNWAMYAPLHHRRAALIAGAPAARLGQAHRLSRRRADRAARLVDPAGARSAACRPALQLALRQRRGCLRRGQDRPAQSRLSQAVGGAGAARALAGAGRALPRSRRLAGRLDLCPGRARRQVIAVDKAPLDPRVAAMAGVQWRGESAFALEPASVGPVDWLFSDIVCYPARLLRLVEKWRASGLVKNFVCTLKFQGATDHDIRPRRSPRIPGGTSPASAPQQARADIHAFLVLDGR